MNSFLQTAEDSGIFDLLPVIRLRYLVMYQPRNLQGRYAIQYTNLMQPLGCTSYSATISARPVVHFLPAFFRTRTFDPREEPKVIGVFEGKDPTWRPIAPGP
jgi:hypothetical protein